MAGGVDSGRAHHAGVVCRSTWPSATALTKPPSHLSRMRRGCGRVHCPYTHALQALPTVMAGKHAVVAAETGTGKTLCYLLPALEAVHLEVATRPPPERDVLLPTALVVVPTQELVHQICAVAARLAPEYAALIRPVYADRGVSRRTPCALLVATPAALKANVSFKLLSALRVVAFDEADLLLSGAYLPLVQGYLLATFKQRPAELRPQHIFCAATLPAKGKASARALLDRYYPPPEVARIVTQGVHRTSPAVRQQYLQLDASLPLTAAEVATLARRTASAKAAGTALDNSASNDAVDASSDSSRHGSGIEAGSPPAPSTRSTSYTAIDDDDEVARQMVQRAAEDVAARVQVDTNTYQAKVHMLRVHAVLQALTWPADRHDSMPVQTATATTAMPTVANAATDAHGDAAPIPRAVPPACVVPLPLPSALLSRIPADAAHRIPPTIVFVNTGGAAEAMRKALAAACPTIQVADLHTRVPAEVRRSRLQAFISGAIRVLVCTNIASRGLDTLQVAHVIQAEFATDVVSHLHRIGRTARAGTSGLVTNLLVRANLPLVHALLHIEADGQPLDAAVSSNRSFAKAARKQTGASGGAAC
jgi:superfamily II DNA/RNA helicase